MDEFEIVTIINRPVEDVFAAIVDLEKMPVWSTGLTEVRQTSPGLLGVGSTVVYVGRFLGRSFESPSEYTEYIPNKRIVTKTTSGPFHLEITTTVEPVDGGTKVTDHYRGETRGFFRVAEPIAVRLAKRQFENDSENLKTLMEENAL
jgi:uncharacterized protein YndB with AHSA1/START domain